MTGSFRAGAAAGGALLSRGGTEPTEGAVDAKPPGGGGWEESALRGGTEERRGPHASGGKDAWASPGGPKLTGRPSEAETRRDPDEGRAAFVASASSPAGLDPAGGLEDGGRRLAAGQEVVGRSGGRERLSASGSSSCKGGPPSSRATVAKGPEGSSSGARSKGTAGAEGISSAGTEGTWSSAAGGAGGKPEAEAGGKLDAGAGGKLDAGAGAEEGTAEEDPRAKGGGRTGQSAARGGSNSSASRSGGGCQRGGDELDGGGAVCRGGGSPDSWVGRRRSI